MSLLLLHAVLFLIMNGNGIRGETTLFFSSKRSRNAQLLLTSVFVADEKTMQKEKPRKTEIPHNFMTPRESHARRQNKKAKGILGESGAPPKVTF